MPPAMLPLTVAPFWTLWAHHGWPVALFGWPSADPISGWLLVAASRTEGVLLHLTWGKGRCLVSGGPKRWSVRRDRDTATGGGEYHYHCEKNGQEFVVKADGRGSHDTKSGTELPRELGEFLAGELDVPLNRPGGAYVVQLLPAWSWDTELERFAIDIVNGALNSQVSDGDAPAR